MDIDEPTALLALFETSPDRFPWQEDVRHAIEEQRVRMSDTLIFDVLLSKGGIRHADSLYPPTNVDGLERLLEAICNCTYDAVKQDSLVYFLLKWHQDGREMDFSESRCIQPQFVILADAYWHLDTGINVERGVSLLADQRLTADYITKIIQALSLSQDPHAAIRKYVRTVQPLLTEPQDMDAYAIALADSSLAEAWSYQRTFAENSPSRPRLVRKIIDFCITPKPRLAQLKALLALHLTSFEQKLLHAYAIDPPPKLTVASAAAIQDLACLRLVQAGEYASAIKLDRQLPPGGTAAKERRQMMDELMAAMPLAERQLLQIELEKLTTPARTGHTAPHARPGRTTTTTAGADLSMSWETVRPPPAAPPAPAAGPAAPDAAPSVGPPTISQRSGAPRFGAPLGATPPTETFAPLAFPASTSVSAGRPRPASLFETAGSANQTPNAFYTPPPSISAGARRTFGQDTPVHPGARRPSASPQRPAPASATPAPAPDHDVTMQVDEDAAAADLADAAQPAVTTQSAPKSSTAEFSASVFGRGAPTERQRSVSARRIRKEKSDSPFIPGGFGPATTDDDEADRFSMPPPPPVTRKPRASTVAGDTSTPARRKTRATHTRAKRSKDVRRSIPGGFATEEEEEEEEEDAVPPLPPPTPTTTKKGGRKPRASRTSGEKDEMTAEELRPRRSTRLSIAPSVGELSSPEPSPIKPSAKTRSTRKSAAAAGTSAPATRSTRKKR